MNTDPNKIASMRSGRAIVGDRFNPAMLVTAREAAGMTQKELSAHLNISQPLVGQWETRLALPSQEHIDAMSRVLGMRSEFFFVDRPRRLASMSDFYHRSFSRAKRSDVKATHARCSVIDLQIDRLLELCALPPDPIPFISPDNHAGDVDHVAAMARVAMAIDAGPIPDLVSVIEACGGIVIDRALEVEDIDALCRWVPGLPKLFFINGSKPTDRIRFSLAHELGHTIMHFDRDIDPKIADNQANTFASAFLMPSRDIRRDFRPMMAIEDFAAMKRKWRVSMQSLIMRAHTLHAIDDTRYTSLFTQLSRRGWRKTEPVTISGETPHAFARLLQAHLEAGYTIPDLAKMLFTDEKKVQALLRDVNSPTWEQHGVRMRLVE
jgi:Zn-dependent peptidase ImmA (M78 family)/transcriptional regulator with XRE-family HTH domain